MVTVLEYEQAEIKPEPEVEVGLLLIVPVVELGTTDGKGLALCTDVELREGDGTRLLLLLLLLLPLLVKLIVVETDWKSDVDVLLTCKLVEDKIEDAAALDADVEADALPKSEDGELCVDDALRITRLDVVGRLVVD